MKHIYILIITIFCAFVSNAQTESTPLKYSLELIKNTPQWGITTSSWIKGETYQNPYGTIFSESTRLGIGAYLNRKNMRLQLNWGISSALDFDIQYYLWEGLNIGIGASIYDQQLEWQYDGYTSSREDFRDLGSASYYQENISIGYANVVFNRFYVNVYAQAGYLVSEKSTNNYIVNDSESNGRLKINNSTKLDDTFVYGGGIEIEMLPYFPNFPSTKERSKGIASKLAISAFIRIELLANSSSNMNYDVAIEEWYDGKFVYNEYSNDYDIYPYDITLGVRWILGR